MNRRTFLQLGMIPILFQFARLFKANAIENTIVEAVGWDIGWKTGGWNIAQSTVTKNKIEHTNYIPIVSS